MRPEEVRPSELALLVRLAGGLVVVVVFIGGYLLTQEMQARVENPGTLFRVSLVCLEMADLLAVATALIYSAIDAARAAKALYFAASLGPLSRRLLFGASSGWRAVAAMLRRRVAISVVVGGLVGLLIGLAAALALAGVSSTGLLAAFIVGQFVVLALLVSRASNRRTRNQRSSERDDPSDGHALNEKRRESSASSVGPAPRVLVALPLLLLALPVTALLVERVPAILDSLYPVG